MRRLRPMRPHDGAVPPGTSSPDQRDLTAAAQPGTTGGFGSPAGPGAPVGSPSPAAARPLRDPEGFRRRIIDLAEAEMRSLTDADAVDEWHRAVLDPRISKEVGLEWQVIELAAQERRLELQSHLADARAELARLESAAEAMRGDILDAATAASRAEARVVQLMQADWPEPDVAPAGDVSAGSGARLALVREQIAGRHQEMARALRQVACESSFQVRSAVASAEQRLAGLNVRVEERERLLREAAAARPAVEVDSRTATGSAATALGSGSLGAPGTGTPNAPHPLESTRTGSKEQAA